jgi:hypothetical protein
MLKSSFSSDSVQQSSATECCAYIDFPAQGSLDDIVAKISKAFPELKFHSTERFDEFPAKEAQSGGYSIALLGPSANQSINGEGTDVVMQVSPLRSHHVAMDVSVSLAVRLRQATGLDCRPLD